MENNTAYYFTLLQSSRGSIGKVKQLDRNGELQKGSPVHNLIQGQASTKTVTSIEEFGEFYSKANTSMAAIYETIESTDDKPFVVTKSVYEKLSNKTGYIARTKEFFKRSNRPGIWVLDLDFEQDGQNIDLILAKLYKAIPILKEIDHFVYPSSSSCLSNSKTGDVLTSVKGIRIAFLVFDESDVPRVANILFKQLWLNGDGEIKITKSGDMRVCTLIDMRMYDTAHVDYCAGAITFSPVVQNRGKPIFHKGRFGALDSIKQIPDLTTSELNQYQELVNDAKSLIASNAATVRNDFYQSKIAEIQAHPSNANSQLTAETLQQAFEKHQLPSDYIVYIELGNAIIPTSVNEIHSFPEKYHGKRCCDPILGLDDQYRLRGKIYSQDQTPTIYSFDNGGQTFRLDAGNANIPEAFQKVSQPKKLSLDDYTVGNYYQNPPKKPSYLIQDRVELNTPCVLVANGGVGKGFMTLELCYAVAARKSSCAWGEVKKHGKAFYISMEDSEEQLHERLVSLSHGAHKNAPWRHDLTLMHTGILSGCVMKPNNEIWQELKKGLIEKQPTVVVFDTLAKFSVGMNLDNPSDMTIIMSEYADLSAQLRDCTLFITHHTNKQGQLMSSQMISNNARCVYYLDKLAIDSNTLKPRLPNDYLSLSTDVNQTISRSGFGHETNGYIGLRIGKNNLGLADSGIEVIYRKPPIDGKRYGDQVPLVYRNQRLESEPMRLNIDPVLIDVITDLRQVGKYLASRIKDHYHRKVIDHYVNCGQILHITSNNGGGSFQSPLLKGLANATLPDWLGQYPSITINQNELIKRAKQYYKPGSDWQTRWKFIQRMESEYFDAA